MKLKPSTQAAIWITTVILGQLAAAAALSIAIYVLLR